MTSTLIFILDATIYYDLVKQMIKLCVYIMFKGKIEIN